jgi:hypothetical protein
VRHYGIVYLLQHGAAIGHRRNSKDGDIEVESYGTRLLILRGERRGAKNGNVEYCESAGDKADGKIYEVTQQVIPEIVWQMQGTGMYIYRGQRIPSLYPGVQW